MSTGSICTVLSPEEDFCWAYSVSAVGDDSFGFWEILFFLGLGLRGISGSSCELCILALSCAGLYGLTSSCTAIAIGCLSSFPMFT